jgi:hypothetical protein
VAAIVGGVVGGLFFLAIIGAIILLCCCINRRNKKTEVQAQAVQDSYATKPVAADAGAGGPVLAQNGQYVPVQPTQYPVQAVYPVQADYFGQGYPAQSYGSYSTPQSVPPYQTSAGYFVPHNVANDYSKGPEAMAVSPVTPYTPPTDPLGYAPTPAIAAANPVAMAHVRHNPNTQRNSGRSNATDGTSMSSRAVPITRRQSQEPEGLAGTGGRPGLL